MMDRPQNHNPLFMEEILSSIFSFLPPSDISQCHQVCQFWRTEAWLDITKRKMITFSNENAIKDYIAFFEQNQARRPFTKYTINDRFWQPSPTMDYFLEHFCTSIVSLDIQGTPQLLLKTELQEKLVNLQHLTVHAGQIVLPLQLRRGRELNSLVLYFKLSRKDETGTISRNVTVLEAFLTHSGRNLTSLTLNSSSTEDFTIEKSEWVALSKELRQTLIVYAGAGSRNFPDSRPLLVPLSSIRMFAYNFSLDSWDLVQLADRVKLPSLKTLAIHLDDPKPNPIALCAFLEAYSHITELDIYFSSWWNPEVTLRPVLFPKLEHLTHLTLRRFRGELDFLEACPNLKSVNLLSWRADFEIVGPNPPLLTTFSSVESAIIKPIGFPKLTSVLTYITSRFHKLRRLQFDAHMPACDQKKCSELIMSRLPHLKQLHVVTRPNPLFMPLDDYDY